MQSMFTFQIMFSCGYVYQNSSHSTNKRSISCLKYFKENMGHILPTTYHLTSVIYFYDFKRKNSEQLDKIDICIAKMKNYFNIGNFFYFDITLFLFFYIHVKHFLYFSSNKNNP